ncbi:hypothetical protein LSCM1_06854 [Leishmania martiniquensis]|uniref:Uncharacterized protein n=1 Tax=Leishmania martiniquensis TaxID=1580590 RepID=A0A836HK60_9TRYP|nr:hypothetical protein LSCM1_06854 [Leishmania martiniquensis]
MTHEFRSLFLPLAAEERAVFSDFFPLLLTSAASVQEAAAAAAAVERSPQPTPPAMPATTNLLGTTSVCFSEMANHISGGRGPAAGAQDQCGVSLRSLVFAVGSARADAVIVVLRSGHIVLYGLDRLHTPPYEKYRIRPLPTTQQLMASRGKSRQRNSTVRAASSGKRAQASGRGRLSDTNSVGSSGAEVTCAALLPLHIAYCCRIPLSEPFSCATASTGGPCRGGSREGKEEDVVYLRGVVGGSDGRVSLFSDSSYTLSFAAHDIPVAQVDAVLLPPCTLDRSVPTNASLTTSARCDNSTGAVVNAAAAAAGEPTPATLQKRQELLAHATQRLGLVTSGNDGVVLLWRRLGDSMSPIVVIRPCTFSSHVAYAVHHPSALSALLSARAPHSSREAAIDAALACPPSSLLHVNTSCKRVLRVRQLASLSPKPAGASASSTVHHESAEEATPTSITAALPGSWGATVTAIATHHAVTLVAMGASLLSLLHLDARSAARVWKAEDTITQLVVRDSVALAVCARSGIVHVLTIHPGTGQVVHQRVYHTYNNRAVYHTSLHVESLLMTIVDVCGSTELVQLPADVLLQSEAQPLGGDYTSNNADDLNLLASMAALRAKVCIEDVQGGSSAAVDSSGSPNVEQLRPAASSMSEANAALDHLNERLLLARYAVPEECDEFMATNIHVL